jgi:membrane protein implicated in regulation of membrane protease activity
MARLHAEQEAREYAAMISPPQPLETFAQRFPNAHAMPFQTTTQEDQDDDELVYADVSRQLALIFNVIISIVCCAGAIWWAAKWWSTPARLALSMSGSLIVAVAEVAVYAGYIRRVGEAKQKEKAKGEVREIVRTWVVGREDGEHDDKAANGRSDMVAVYAKVEEKAIRERKRRG